MGIPATGKPVNITGIAIDRFVDDQLVEHREVFDQMGFNSWELSRRLENASDN